MSVTMPIDERVWELKLQMVADKLDGLTASMNDKMAGLTDVVKTGYASIYKMLDDHENRLRKQSEIDSNQGAEISNIRVQMSNLEGQMRALTVLVETASKREEERASKEIGFWQKATFELFKVAMAAGTGGGAVYLGKVLRIF